MSKLHELQPFKASILEKDNPKKKGVLMTVGGVFQRAEAKNANGRIYPRQLWQEVLTNKDTKSRLENRQMVGTLGHPASGQTDPEKISHVITKQELRSNNEVYGEADILDTPMGRIAATLFESGVMFGISSRGDGSVEKKGGADEVKDDYRLETYDFVLKPSTPGAYPGIVENIEENEKLVAEAIEGLVKSELPGEQRMPVLLECLKILSVLEAQNSGDQVEKVSKLITEEVKDVAPRPLITVEAREPTAPESVEHSIEEDTTMGQNPNAADPKTGYLPTDPSSSMDPAILRWHQGQIEAAVQSAIGPKEQEVTELKNTLIQAQREHTETKRKLKAAEEIIDEFQQQIKELSEGANPADAELQRRYEAAVELLDAAIERLPEVGQLKRRTEALEGLLQASIDKVNEERIEAAINESLEKLPASMHEDVRPMLENCKTPEEVAETFKGLVAISGRRPQRHDPLPGDDRLNEDRTPNSARPRTFVGALHQRLSKAV